MSGAIKVISAAGGSVSITADDTLTTDEVLIVGPQAWVDETANRVPNTDYTNNTGRPISLNITGDYGSATVRNLTVDGIVITRSTNFVSGQPSTLSFDMVIPAGSTYSIDNAVTQWLELK